MGFIEEGEWAEGEGGEGLLGGGVGGGGDGEVGGSEAGICLYFVGGWGTGGGRCHSMRSSIDAMYVLSNQVHFLSLFKPHV